MVNNVSYPNEIIEMYFNGKDDVISIKKDIECMSGIYVSILFEYYVLVELLVALTQFVPFLIINKFNKEILLSFSCLCALYVERII